jgi:hypothetical protein
MNVLSSELISCFLRGCVALKVELVEAIGTLDSQLHSAYKFVSIACLDG